MDFGEFGAAGDLFIVLVRWVHAIAAVAWVGGSAFFALIIRPALAADPDGMGRVMGRLTGPYRELVDISIIAITVSGLILMFERLTGDDASVTYFIVLGVKLALAAWMFHLVFTLRRSGFVQEERGGWRSRVSWLLGYNALLAFGVTVYLLAGVLRSVFERAISG